MLLAEIALTPLDKGSSVSAQVAAVVDIIDRSGLDYRIGPMGTCIEGEWQEVMAVLGACFERMAASSDRVSIAFKGDWRRGASGRLTAKIETVERLLGRPLRR